MNFWQVLPSSTYRGELWRQVISKSRRVLKPIRHLLLHKYKHFHYLIKKLLFSKENNKHDQQEKRTTTITGSKIYFFFKKSSAFKSFSQLAIVLIIFMFGCTIITNKP